MYYKTSHKAWYTSVGGRQIRLGRTEEEAQAKLAPRPIATTAEAVARFLDRPMSPGTRAFYERSLKVPNLPISELRPHHIVGCRNSQRAAKTCFQWCKEKGHIDVSPLADMTLPTATGRGDDVFLTKEQIRQLFEHCPEDLRDVLTTLHETGCRPQEMRLVTANQVENMCWVFARGKGNKPRVVHLSARVWDICQRLALKHPEGSLFRNQDGNPWSNAAIVGRFERLSEKVGFHVTAYSFRHTFATNALERGVDPITLAALLGHSDLKMIQRCYAHLQRRASHLQLAVEKIVA